MTCGQRVRAVHAESDACLSAGASESRHLRGAKEAQEKRCCGTSLSRWRARACWRGRARARRRRRASRSTPRRRRATQRRCSRDQRGSGERSGRHEAAARLFEQLEARGQRGERGDTELDGGGEAEKLARVAEGMGDIEHEALAVAGDAARTSVRLTDFVKLFATFSGSVNGGGKTCIGKATGSGQDAATTNGPADYIYADLGCDVSPEEMATMKRTSSSMVPHLRRWAHERSRAPLSATRFNSPQALQWRRASTPQTTGKDAHS
ncbi:hypothetical protein ERJ75_001117500 [Trypanosoma vivax]|nr:hypothetical protein ERJ75_001117500 [Trypanosoma vivax]